MGLCGRLTTFPTQNQPLTIPKTKPLTRHWSSLKVPIHIYPTQQTLYTEEMLHTLASMYLYLYWTLLLLHLWEINIHMWERQSILGMYLYWTSHRGRILQPLYKSLRMTTWTWEARCVVYTLLYLILGPGQHTSTGVWHLHVYELVTCHPSSQGWAFNFVLCLCVSLLGWVSFFFCRHYLVACYTYIFM